MKKVPSKIGIKKHQINKVNKKYIIIKIYRKKKK